VLPSGPTVADILANGAFYFGLVRVLAQMERPVWSQMSFSAAEENFHAGARLGIDAQLYWPGMGTVPVEELVLRRLLPLAYQGLDSWGVDPAERDRLLGIIEQRCLTGMNGAAWQLAVVRHFEDEKGMDRFEAQRAMLERYITHMHTNAPVHEWPIE
jgi:hypothetical protein